jgi:multisubunit Na+/H+ antiporter MnhE subunit
MGIKPPIFSLVWVSQWLLWVLFANNAGAREIIIGAVASAFATWAVARFQGHLKDHFYLSASNMSQVIRTPELVASGTYILFRVIGLRLLGRNVPGGLAAVHFTLGGNDPKSRGRRALATTFLTIAPNNLVLGFLPDEQKLLFHTVIPQKLPSFLFKMGATLEPTKENQT